MQNHRTFGRRVGQAPPMARPRLVAQTPPPALLPVAPGPVASAAASVPQPEPDVTFETDAPQDRPAPHRPFSIPWRPLSLMAGLSFGMGSLVLPDWINDFVQWPLGALTLASIYTGWLKPRNATPKPQRAEIPEPELAPLEQ